jgi:hypothetical protein
VTLRELCNFWRSHDGSLLERFVGACLKAAYAVTNESAQTANHANRLTWANAVLLGDEAAVEAKARQHLRYAISANATLQTAGDAVTDGDIEYIVITEQLNLFATG